MSKVIVVAPHPDDETLGAGGTLLKHIEAGDDVYWLVMTKLSSKVGFSEERIKARELEVQKVSREYGFKEIFQLDFVTTELDQYAIGDLVKQVSNVFQKVSPEIIYVPWANDIHTDHYYCFKAVEACSKSFRYPFIKSVFAYETLSETEFSLAAGTSSFSPNYFVDISSYLKKKIEMMKLYAGEMGEFPFPRSEEAIESLAKLRGSRISCSAGEAFMTLFQTWKDK